MPPRGLDVFKTLPAILCARGWTQARLAEETGLERSDIAAFCNYRVDADGKEHGKRVGRERLQRIVEVLDISPVELGLPPDQADDGRGRDLLDRLEELGEQVAEVLATQERILRDLDDARTRLARLEAGSGGGAAASRRQGKR